MTSKSRLGKGLGALFPTLPGEQDANAQPELLPDTNKSDGAEAKAGAAASAAKKSAKSPAAGAAMRDSAQTEDNAAGAAEVNAKQTTVKQQKKSSAKRASMPSIGAIAHPSDLFFGGEDVPVATTPVDTFMPIPGAAQQHAVREDVSRETSQSAETAAGAGEQQAENKPVELKPVEGGYLAELKLADIGPNAHQPRTIFDEDELNELSASIKEVGVLQPIVVRRRPAEQIVAAKAEQHHDDETGANPFAGRMDSPYELIMGERRWRASQLAGLETIPAIVKTTADDDMLRDALLENLHRVALNPLEEAAAYQQMIDEFGLTQAQLSKSVSKSRPQIANTLRLLNLPAAVQKKVAAGVLSSGHARALLGLTDPEEMDKLASRIIAEGLSVRSTEEIVSMKIASGEQPKKPKTSKTNPWVGSAIQQSLENHFDTKVSIKGTQKHGRIEIVFSSPEDMDRILQLLVPGQGDAAGAGSSESKWV